MSWTAPENLSGRIETYGSFQLGISAKGADIDALCIAPQHITMAEYFNSFVQFLVLVVQGLVLLSVVLDLTLKFEKLSMERGLA